MSSWPVVYVFRIAFWGLGMRLGIMQPYFLPYIGYFQLISAVDSFVLYDNIKYTKKGWVNRNRILVNGKDAVFSVPLKKDSDFLNVCERSVSEIFRREELLRKVEGAYKKSPFFDEVFPVLADVVLSKENNLFDYIYQSVLKICAYLRIDTKIMVSSGIPIDHSLRSQEKVLAFCRNLRAKEYINPIGGTELYERERFLCDGIDLKFIRTIPFEYKQFGGGFVPGLSIIDVLMFNPLDTVREHIYTSYEFV